MALSGAPVAAPARVESTPLPLEFTQRLAGNFTITAVRQNHYTYTVQVKRTATNETVLSIPIDPLDNTVAATIKSELLGDDKAVVLLELPIYLDEHFGAKAFIKLSPGDTLVHFVSADEFKACPRIRVAQCSTLRDAVASRLLSQPEWVAQANRQYRLLTDEKARGYDAQIVASFAGVQGRFTALKKMEYDEAKGRGMRGRFHNEHIQPFLLVDAESNQLCGMVRALRMGGGDVYFSDTIVDPDIIDADKFEGSTPAEKAIAREKFLFAYLMMLVSRAPELALTGSETLVTIAAEGREGTWTALGYEPSLPDVNIQVRFGPPKPVMTAIKGVLTTPSVVEIISASRGYAPAGGSAAAGSLESRPLTLRS